MKHLTEHLNNSFSLNTHNINEMTRIGYVGKFEIIVYTDDPGNIPHVHVIDASTRGQEFDSCVKLESAEYFPHGGKHTDKFNSKQRKDFNTFMSSKPGNNRYKTYYEYACSMWNDNNSKYVIDESNAQPNYTNLA